MVTLNQLAEFKYMDYGTDWREWWKAYHCVLDMWATEKRAEQEKKRKQKKINDYVDKELVETDILNGIMLKLNGDGQWCEYRYNKAMQSFSVSIDATHGHDIYKYIVSVKNKTSQEVVDEICEMFRLDFIERNYGR